MITPPRLLFMLLLQVAAILSFAIVQTVVADKPKERPIPPAPTQPFSPSNARTESGETIPVEQFFSAKRCAGCHHDTHAAWSESLHRNAAREPFYRESVDILLRTRGIEFTRHCESCHTPVALFSGALTKNSPRQQAPFTSLEDRKSTRLNSSHVSESRMPSSD